MAGNSPWEKSQGLCSFATKFKYDAILVFGLFVAAVTVFLHMVDMVTEATLAESMVVMWLSYRASDRLYKYDRRKERELYRK